MGLFSDIGGFVGDVLGGSGGSVVGDVLGAGLGIAGNFLAGEAQQDALEDSIQFSKQNRDAALVDLTAGFGQARESLQPVLDETAGSRGVLRERALAPTRGLQPWQNLALEDIGDAVRTNLKTSGLAGAGRGGVALYNDAMRRAVTDFWRENDAQKLNAASTLEARDAATRGAQSNTFSQEATNKANTRIGTGSGIAGGLADLGNVEAGQIASSFNIAGDTLGTLGATLADKEKRENRDAYSGYSSPTA